MKKFMVCALLTAFVGFAGIASAQEQDLAALPCGDLIKANEQTQQLIIFWIDGYMSAQSENTVMSDEWIEKLAFHMGSYCAKNPKHNIMQAMNALPAE